MLLKIVKYLKEKPLCNVNNEETKILSNINWITINHHKNIYNITTSSVFHIQYTLTSLLDSLTWHTKKCLDYYDWKFIIAILIKGVQYMSKGMEPIKKITDQMDDHRLSTFKPKIEYIPFKSEV